MEESPTVGKLSEAESAVKDDVDDDQELENRTSQFTRKVGTWLKPFVGRFHEQIEALNTALEQLGLVRGSTEPVPKYDARLSTLCALIDRYIRLGNTWSQDERLVVFTEYKTTLDYLYRRLMDRYKESNAIRVLFGGNGKSPDGRPMGDHVREQIKNVFNDPSSPVRILIATDTASEGQNIQETCRYLLHYDIPWNPSRLEQRNGRLDRHGQARDVKIFHFTTDDDADMKFLAYVVKKANAIREDLGSMGEIFDAAFQRRFFDNQNPDAVIPDIDLKLDARKQETLLPEDAGQTSEATLTDATLDTLSRQLDLSPETLKSTLEVALGIEAGLPRLDSGYRAGEFRLRPPLPRDWESLIDQTLRREETNALQGLTFDPAAFIESKYGRPVFRARKDTALMHLGHPLIRQAIIRLNQLRYPGQKEQHSTWTVRFGAVPSDADCLVLLTVEELAVNELREPYHHWVNTIRIPGKSGRLLEPLTPILPSDDIPSTHLVTAAEIQRARDIWLEVEEDIKNFLTSYQTQLTAKASDALTHAKANALKDEKDKFTQRAAEVEEQLKRTTKKNLEEERDRLLIAVQQLSLLAEDQRAKEENLRNVELELETRTKDLTDLLDYLTQDHERMIKEVIPKRFTMRGQVQVYPVTLEIRLPEAAA